MTHRYHTPWLEYGRMTWWMSSGLLLVVLLTVSRAQVRTTITSDGSLGTVVTQSGTVYNLTGGTRPRNGPNLFHSFDRFSVGTHDTARFIGQPGIENILSRVTGGQPSIIDGLLQSQMDGVNLYLLNPSGVMFGPNARLDVSGSFHVSTADYLRLADGGRFSTRLSDTSTLSVAPPEAFGFLGPTPAPLTIDRSVLKVPVGQTLSLIGGDIKIIGGCSTACDLPNLSAPSGRINVISVAAAGDVVPNFVGQISTPEIGALSHLGSINIEQGALLSTSGDRGGTITIRGGHFLIDGAFLFADTLGNRDGAQTGIDIQGVGDVVVRNGGLLTADTTATGQAGNIVVQGRDIVLSDGGQISSNTLGPGQGGRVSVTATETLTLRGANSSIGTTAAGQEAGAGAAGTVVVQARNVVLSDAAQINSATLGPGQGGAVSVTATETLTGLSSSGVLGGTVGQEAGAGAAGTVVVQARNVMLSDGAQIGSLTFGPGSAGMVQVTATETLSLRGSNQQRNPSAVFASAEGREAGAGAAGTVVVQARNVVLSDGAQIGSGTFGPGPGGAVNVTATETLMLRGTSPQGNPSGVFASAEGREARAGAAGMVTVQARNVVLSDGAQIASGTRGPGPGGTVSVTATETLTLMGEHSGLRTSAEGSGQGGDIVLQARAVHLTEGASISAQSSGTGNAGTIRLQVHEQLKSTKSTITTQAKQSGGGDITIEAGVVHLTTDSRITAAAVGAPGVGSNGGNVTMRAQAMALNHSQVQANAFGGQGGHIRIESGVLLTDAGTCAATSCLDASSGVGLPGTVEVGAPETEVRGAVAPLPQAFASAATLLRDRCTARLHEGTVSSLVERGRDGVPAHPGGLLPSRLSGAPPAAATPRAAGQRRYKTPVAQQNGLQRNAHGQIQITNWPASATSAQVQDVECAHVEPTRERLRP